MPYTIRKVRNQPCYKVYNKKTKKVHAKCTSREKAQKQIRLLNAIKYNKKFKLNKTRKNSP
mgnify:FL=1|tara:strand:- start:3658 stop:3840 length:183 start_codon:yes stop_codon:yes gene_type:complete